MKEKVLVKFIKKYNYRDFWVSQVIKMYTLSQLNIVLFIVASWERITFGFDFSQ